MYTFFLFHTNYLYPSNDKISINIESPIQGYIAIFKNIIFSVSLTATIPKRDAKVKQGADTIGWV